VSTEMMLMAACLSGTVAASELLVRMLSLSGCSGCPDAQVFREGPVFQHGPGLRTMH
jgi:hypothetical protein